LETGTRAHYESAEYYDLAYRQVTDDINYYLETAWNQGGPVLELGCGTGRITLQLARAGLTVTGIDISTEMLDQARRKLAREPRRVAELVEKKHPENYVSTLA